jgi:hypothetical protein
MELEGREEGLKGMRKEVDVDGSRSVETVNQVGRLGDFSLIPGRPDSPSPDPPTPSSITPDVPPPSSTISLSVLTF